MLRENYFLIFNLTMKNIEKKLNIIKIYLFLNYLIFK